MSEELTAEGLLARFVEHHVRTGEATPARALCGDRTDLLPALEAHIERYLKLSGLLDRGASGAPGVADGGPLPTFAGFQTIERLGAGGSGEVFKLRDLELGRLVAGKVIRRGGGLFTTLPDFLREARTLALFKDRRIAQIHELRPAAEPPVIIMEYVEGFPLTRVAPSLEFAQRARILLDLCEAVDHAHGLGIQHRDLKPANVLLDAELRPRILDFGLSQADPHRGHLVGSLPYMAPEQLDPAQPIDGRADVYALGVIFYELLCGRAPFAARTEAALAEAVRSAEPPLPLEVEPDVPEPLQAIALKAIERQPDDRYPTPQEMARDLRRFLDGQPVLARPRRYASALGRRVGPHLADLEEWLRLKLVYPHEAERLRSAYAPLSAREDDWIVESRRLSHSQIALYVGACLLGFGALLYFGVHRIHGKAQGLAWPLLVLGLPLAGLSAAARALAQRERRAVAVAFHMGAVLLLPVLLLVVFHELGLWVVSPETDGQLFQKGWASNRQLQVASLSACAYAAWLAARTRTVALSSMATALGVLGSLAVMADRGLRSWVTQGKLDVLAAHLVPVMAVAAISGWRLEGRRSHFTRPLYLAAAALLVLALELAALDGRAFARLGLSMARFQGDVKNPVLLDTLTAMSLGGVVIYCTAWVLDRRGTELMKFPSWLLATVSPFAALEPLAWLNGTEQYARAFDWLYLALAVGVCLASHYQQRKSFYFAGLLNLVIALWLITSRYRWSDQAWWAAVLVGAGLAAAGVGFALDRVEQGKRRP